MAGPLLSVAENAGPGRHSWSRMQADFLDSTVCFQAPQTSGVQLIDILQGESSGCATYHAPERWVFAPPTQSQMADMRYVLPQNSPECGTDTGIDSPIPGQFLRQDRTQLATMTKEGAYSRRHSALCPRSQCCLSIQRVSPCLQEPKWESSLDAFFCTGLQ